MTNDKSDLVTRQSFFTVEIALWILVAVVALALRLSHLDAAPLNGREAREAMLAWRAATGQGMSRADYSPLLFAANALLFTLCGASDTLARLWPALFGSALALTPFLLRQRIGRVGALAAGLYLALSPTPLFASRQLDGAVVAAVGGMVFLGGLVRFLDTGKRLWLTLSAGGLALAVTSSPAAYGLLLALGLAWLIFYWIWPNRKVTPPHPHPHPHPHSSFFILHSPLVIVHCSLFIVHCSLFTLALSTGLGWNPAGLGAAGDLLPAWVTRFSSASNPLTHTSYTHLLHLLVYEPLVLLFGIGGLVWAIRRGQRFGVLMGLWAGLGILLLTLMPGRTPADVLWIILPLAVLSGSAVEVLVQSLRTQGAWLGEGLYAPVVLILWVHCYLVLARYAETGDPMNLALVLLAVVLQVLLAVIFALAMRFDTALRGVAVGTGVALLAVTLSAGWGAAYVRPADPRELLVRQPTAVEVRDLVETLRDLSWRETGIPTTLSFTLDAAPDSVVAWYLRDFSAADRVESLDVGEIGPVLVTSRRDLMLADVECAGQDFALRRSWDPLEIGCTWQWPPRCNTAVGWLLLRRTPSPPVTDEWVVLWLRAEE